MRAKPAADDTPGSNENAGADVQRGDREQNRLRVIPDQINECSEEDYGERRSRSGQVHLLEAGVAPGTHHEKREQAQQREPER